MNTPEKRVVSLEQQRLVRESFTQIAELAGPIALLFYGRLFDLDPKLRPMFKQDIGLQGVKLMEMLSVVTQNLGRFEELVPRLKALGQRHAGYGVRLEHYEEVEAALMWAIGKALDRDFYPELKAAWMAVIGSVSAVMKEGAAELPST